MTVAWQRVEELLKRFQVGIEPTTSVTPVGQVVISVTHHLLHSKPLFISYMPFKSVTIIASNIGPARLCLHGSLFGEAENRSNRKKNPLKSGWDRTRFCSHNVVEVGGVVHDHYAHPISLAVQQGVFTRGSPVQLST